MRQIEPTISGYVRPGFEPDVVFLSVPYERIHNLIVAIPYCSAGDAEAYIPEEFQSD